MFTYSSLISNYYSSSSGFRKKPNNGQRFYQRFSFLPFNENTAFFSCWDIKKEKENPQGPLAKLGLNTEKYLPSRWRGKSLGFLSLSLFFTMAPSLIETN